MSYKAMDVARHVITLCSKEEQPISNLQLQKILYYAQADSLRYGSPLFEDEIEAWQFGPVVPEVYWRYCGYGANPIRAEYSDDIISASSAYMIDSIAREKRKLAPWDLVEETHQKGHAWDLTYNNGEGNRRVIKKELISHVG